MAEVLKALQKILAQKVGNFSGSLEREPAENPDELKGSKDGKSED